MEINALPSAPDQSLVPRKATKMQIHQVTKEPGMTTAIFQAAAG